MSKSFAELAVSDSDIRPNLHKLIFMLQWFTIVFLNMSNSGVTTESGGRQNMFPSETRRYIDESVSYEG